MLEFGRKTTSLVKDALKSRAMNGDTVAGQTSLPAMSALDQTGMSCYKQRGSTYGHHQL